MNYVIALLAALLSTCVVFVYATYEGVLVNAVSFLPRKKLFDEEFTPYSLRSLVGILCALSALSFLSLLSLLNNTELIGTVKLYALFLITACAAVIDFKRKIIPNILVLFGLLFWVGITFYEFFYSENFKSIVVSELLGFALGFVLLAVVSLVTKGAIGFGDVKLFGLIGLISGAFCTYSTLLVSLVISVIVSLVGMIAKKLSRKDTIPFGPCIFAGYLVVLFLGSY